jgi:hypothetical protein
LLGYQCGGKKRGEIRNDEEDGFLPPKPKEKMLEDKGLEAM